MSRYIWPLIGLLCYIVDVVSVFVYGKQVSNIRALFYGSGMTVFWFLAVWATNVKR